MFTDEIVPCHIYTYFINLLRQKVKFWSNRKSKCE